MKYFIIDGKEYTSINVFVKEFGISYGAIKPKLEACGIGMLVKNNRKYIERDFLEKSKNESAEIVGFKEIVEELSQKLNSNVDVKSFTHLNKLITYISGNNYFGLLTLNPVYKKSDPLNFYIYQKDREKLEGGITEYLLLYNKPYNIKINILFDDVAFHNQKITVECAKEYLSHIDNKKRASYVETVNFLRLTSKKDLAVYTDEDISNYFKFASSEMTNAGCANLVGLYKYMQGKAVCKSETSVKYQHITSNKMDTSSYDIDTYLKLAYMVFNEDYWMKNNMIQKAIRSERCAKIWLYHAMHYVCDWRKEDIFSKIPRITLDGLPQKILADIESGGIYKKQYESASFEIASRVNQISTKPGKTKWHKNTPPLRLYIPESLSRVIGMLAMMCEAHNQINNNNDALCYLKRGDADGCIRFFGDEYSSLFNGSMMSNRRANKSHMLMLSDTGEELKTDGYLIASFARSHTGGINRIPDVTSRYLKAKMDGYTIDEMTIALFERGICSFVPYLLCSTLNKNEFQKLNINEQTIAIKCLSMKAYDIENLLQVDDIILVDTKQKVLEIIKWANEDNADDLIKEALERIVNGECTGKNEGIYCIRRACGKECSEKSEYSVAAEPRFRCGGSHLSGTGSHQLLIS